MYQKLQFFTPAESSFTIMEYFGLWRPQSWTSKWAIRLYDIYNCLMLTFVTFFVVTFFIGACQNFDDLDVLTENAFFSSAGLALIFKTAYICKHREDMINLKNMFQATRCQPRDFHEMEIRIKFHETDRLNLRIYLIIGIITATAHAAGPLTRGKSITLPFRSWAPHNIDSRSIFWMIYFYQSFSIMIAMVMFITVETVASVMMQQICAQLEILMYRLQEVPQLCKINNTRNDNYRRESELMENCIIHHVHIFSIERKLNDIFGSMVFVQFFATTVNLCSVVFQLSKMTANNVKFWSVSGILSIFVLQILLYCWYGEEMIQKSLAVADAVYKMNWTLLTVKTKKNLIMMMVRARRPMKLSGASMITMSVGTYVKIIRTSYSAFNLLRST